MKKKWIFIAVAVLAAVALAVTGLLLMKQKKDQPGFHFVDGRLYANVNGSGYAFLMDDKGQIPEKDCEGQTQIVVQGSTDANDNFKGTLSVSGFPVTEKGTISGAATMVDAGNGFYEIHWNPVCTHEEVVGETNDQGATLSTHSTKQTHSCNYQYIYQFCPEKPEFAAVYIYDIAKADYYCVILADSEAQARELFRWMKDNEK